MNIGHAQSILQSNYCVKISVEEDGVYKITYDDFKKWGFNDLTNISIYGNQIGEIPLINNTENPDTLHEISIKIESGDDNIFNSGDYILFYGQSPNTWTYDNEKNTFSHNKHHYEDKNYYYVVNKKYTQQITQSVPDITNTSITISSFDHLQFYEKNETNPINTGRNFFESVTNNKTISFSTPHVITSEPATISVSFAARHTSAPSISILANNTPIGSITFLETTTNKPFARLKTQSFQFLPTENTTIGISLLYSGANSRGFLDYCTLQSRCLLKIDNNDQLLFRDTRSAFQNTNGTFNITTKNKVQVWDITNSEHPIEITTRFSENKTSFVSDLSELHEFVAFSSSFKSVKFEEIMQQQDILSDSKLDMVIITNSMFKDYAQQIANLHSEIDNFSCKVVLQKDICEEFSGGKKDISSIRNYLRYLYNKGNKQLKYVLLFGDGTFDNKKVSFDGPYIFTFQTNESLNEDNSICSDDFFGLLDKNEGVESSDLFKGEIDIAIGRFPVSTKKEAEAITYKTIQYATNPSYRGDWQNYLCFLADDANENQTMHMSDADLLCTSIAENYPQFNFDKIFADAYKQVRSSAGERYPDVNEAINNRIQKGCLIFNYSGHGNETRMMAEYAVEASDVESWKNTTKLPFFIAAACNIAHFDYDGKSLGEKLLTQKDGGGIGLISATRYSYASANYTLCDNIYKTIFSPDSLYQTRTIGESFVLAKKSTYNDFYQNKRIYTLLGDPALRLAIPTYDIVIDSINGKEISTFTDTINALSTIKITGHIEYQAKVESNYNGILYVKLFDKSQSITTLGNDNNDLFTFNSYTNILFQGRAEIINGQFSFSAKIPTDIYYYDGKGKLSLYATNDTIQAFGAFQDFVINGSTIPDDDNLGPEIKMFFNNKPTDDKITTNQNPTIHIELADASGINISEASIGHNIVLTIDDNISNQIILNDFYYADLNTFTSGKILYQLNNLEDGEHTINLVAYDTYNNASETELQFYVCNSKDIRLTNLYNFPNPMTDKTYFHFEHNQADNDISVTLKIFDICGNLVRIITCNGVPSNFYEESLCWDGKSSNGSTMNPGIYPYTIEIKTANGEKILGEQKILLTK